MKTNIYENTPVTTAIAQAGTGARKMQKIFDNIKKTATALNTKPFLVPLPMEINFEGASYPTFAHGRGLRQTHIIIGLKGGSEPLHFRGDSQVLENIYDHIKEFSYSNELLKRFDVSRFPPVGTVEDSRVQTSYISFIKEIFSVMYKNAYDKTLPLNINLSIRKNTELSLENSNDLLLHDLLSESAFSAVSYFNEIYEKITDDELGCSVMISSHNFLHPINQLLSPAALALSFWQYNLLGLKKVGKEENIFAKPSLPKVTYIDITGFFSEINLEMVNALSENIQTILVYDSSTGGPNILRSGCYNPGQDIRSRERNFTQISSDNALLIPLKSTNNYGEKVYSPNDMLGIFDELIVRSIEKFKPTLIVLNVSFIFEESNNLPFWLDEKAFGEILNTLNTLSDGRVVVYPFKLPDLRKNPSDRATFNQLKDLLGDKPKQVQRLENIFTKYGVSYNPSYLINCLSSTLEALAGMRNSNTWERSDIRKRYGTNPVKADTVHQICRFYKSHIYYNFLYSKATGALARLNKENVVKVKQGRSSKIPVFYNNKDGDTTMLKLSFQNGCRKIELDEQYSQYLVDYSNPEEPYLYMFNAILSETDLGVAVPRSTSHIKVPLEIDDMTQPYVNITDITENDLRQFIVDKEKGVYTDVGLCKSGDYVFQVYGTQCNQKGEKKDVTEIFCYDFENEQTFPIKLKGGSHNIMPRHSVTACAFEKNNVHYIYVFGGVAQPNTSYNGKKWGRLDIIDIVESYKTEGPITAGSVWEYYCHPKDVMYKSSNACYIPYVQSYAYYAEDINKILILGGRMFRDSVQEWTFPIFEFDIADQRFSSFQVVLNYTRNNFSRKEVKNHNSKKAAFPIAVANKNVNFRLLSGDKKFNFIIPTQDPEYIYTYYFDWKTKECQYEQILHKEDKAEEKTPVLPSQSSVPGKNVPMTTRISEIMDYFSTDNKGFGKVVIKLIDWRSDIDDDVIKEEILQEKLKEFKEQPNEDFTDQEEFKSIVDSVEKLIKLKDFKDIFLNRDNRLQLLKNYVSRKSPREDAAGEIEFPNVDHSFKLNDMRTGYESLPGEIIKNGKDMTKICISLIDWRLKNKQEKLSEQTLSEKIELIKAVAKSTASKDSRNALENIGRLFKNEKLIKIFVSDTDQLKPLRKILSGVEGQNFLFSDSTRDSSSSLEESVDSFYLSTRNTIFTKDDSQWGDLDSSQRNNVLEILNKSIQLFSTLSEDPKSFSVKAFSELEQGLQRVRKSLTKDSDSSGLMDSLEDTVTYITKTYNSSTRNPNLSGSYDSNASKETAASLHLSAELDTPSDISLRSYEKNFMKVKEDFSNISVKQLLHTLLTGCQQVINVSHMHNAGFMPQIEYSRDLFERKFLEPLCLIKNNLEGETSHEQSTEDSSQINSILKSTNQDDNQIDTKNMGQILNESVLQPPTDSKPVQEPSVADSPQKKPVAVPPKQTVVSPPKQTAAVPPQKVAALKEPAVQPTMKHVETKNQEIQTEPLSLPSMSVKEVDEKNIDDLSVFKAALSVQNDYRAFYNSSRSELTIMANDKDGKLFTRRLRFKVLIKDAEEKSYIVEDISFENSPSSIWIHNDCVVCYIDQAIKIRYQDVYKVYKSWILYADLKTSPEHSDSWKEVENLVFRKLFLITQDDQMINRCLLTDENNLFLLAGKSYRFRKNNAVANNQVSLYNLKKFTKIEQTSSHFKDPDADHLESIKGESVSVSTPKFIFICPRKDPSKMEIYDKRGNVVEEVDLLGNFKNSFVSMTYVNFKGKDAILFTQHRTDKNREFKLYYIKEKSFEEEEVKLEPTEVVEEDKKFQMLYSGFEEPEVNTTTKPIAETIMFNIIRDDITKCVPCKITIG